MSECLVDDEVRVHEAKINAMRERQMADREAIVTRIQIKETKQELARRMNE